VSRGRSSLARFGAPAAFLVAATIAILLVRSATSHGEASTPPRANVPHTTSTVAEPPPPPTTTPGTTVPADAEFYEIEAGDTLDLVADRFDTTVERLLVLNPDVDPVALRIGQRIRVK
jgi:LysM repeat protein